MDIKYVPDSMKIEGALFEGHFIVDPPLYEQRLDYLSECGIGIDQEGKYNLKLDDFKTIVKVIKMVIPHIKESNIIRKEDGYKFSSNEELRADEQGGILIQEVCMSLIRGLRISKN